VATNDKEDELTCDNIADTVIKNDEDDDSTYADMVDNNDYDGLNNNDVMMRHNVKSNKDMTDNDNFHLDDSGQYVDATISFFQKFDFLHDFTLFKMDTTVFDNNVAADNTVDDYDDSLLDV